MNKKLVFRAALLIVIVGVLSVGYRMLFPAQFDMAKWRSASSPADFMARREVMSDVNRMISDHTIKDRDTAQRYLGDPQRGKIESDSFVLYDLGGQPNASAPGPHEWLEIVFTTNGDIASTRIRQDTPGPE